MGQRMHVRFGVAGVLAGVAAILIGLAAPAGASTAPRPDDGLVADLGGGSAIVAAAGASLPATVPAADAPTTTAPHRSLGSPVTEIIPTSTTVPALRSGARYIPSVSPAPAAPSDPPPAVANGGKTATLPNTGRGFALPVLGGLALVLGGLALLQLGRRPGTVG
jgi:hypothetical protein